MSTARESEIAASRLKSSAKKKPRGNPNAIKAFQFKKNDPASGFVDERINRTALQVKKRTIVDDIEEDLDELVLCSDGIKRTNRKRVAMSIRSAALKGKMDAATILLDRTVGKVPPVGIGSGEIIPATSGTQVNVNVHTEAYTQVTSEEGNRPDLASVLRDIYGLSGAGVQIRVSNNGHGSKPNGASA